MKKVFVTILLLLATTSYASQKAITDTGKEVILHSDGTWEYADTAQKVAKIKTNKTNFERSKNASFFLKSMKNNSAFWINTDRWSFSKAEHNPEAEYEFQLKGEDLYAMALTERITIPLERLAGIAYSNSQRAAPDAKIVRQEYRVVNGNKVLYMEMNATTEGIKFAFSGYYYSDDSGSTQFVTWTSTNLVDKYKSEIDEFLNGLATQ